MIPLGLILAGLFFIFRILPPLLVAQRTGVLIKQSGARVERATEPERFAKFWRLRAATLGVPLILIAVGGLWLASAFVTLPR